MNLAALAPQSSAQPASLSSLIDEDLDRISDELLPYLVRSDVESIAPAHRANFMLFPQAGFALWLFAFLLAAILVSLRASGELDLRALPLGLLLLSLLAGIPIAVMVLRSRRFLYREKAFNVGIIKTPEAYLIRLERESFSLLPYAALRRVRLVEGGASDDAQILSLDLALDYEEAGTIRSLLVRGMIHASRTSCYLDSADKRRVAAFFAPQFEENELSSFELYREKAARESGGKWGRSGS